MVEAAATPHRHRGVAVEEERSTACSVPCQHVPHQIFLSFYCRPPISNPASSNESEEEERLSSCIGPMTSCSVATRGETRLPKAVILPRLRDGFPSCRSGHGRCVRR